MVYTCLAQLFWAGSSQATSVAVPSAAQIVLDSESVAAGVLRTRDRLVFLEIQDVLKGNAQANAEVRIDSRLQVSEFDLSRFAEPLNGKAVIILGDISEDVGALVLPWLGVSVWPYGDSGIHFAPDDLDASRTFAERILTYDRLAKTNSGELVATLFRDAKMSQRQDAVLGFLAAERGPLRSDEPALFKSTLVAMVAEISQRAQTDQRTTDYVAAVSPELPPTLAVDYFLMAATTGAESARPTAKSQIEAILRIRGLLARGQDNSIAELEQIYRSQAFAPYTLRDANEAFLLFDANIPDIRDRAGDVLWRMLATPSERNQASAKQKNDRHYWARRIAALEND